MKATPTHRKQGGQPPQPPVHPPVQSSLQQPSHWPSWFPIRDHHILSVLLLIGFLFYINTAGNKYALDDGMVITENNYTKMGFKGIGKILTTDSFEGLLGEEGTAILEGGRYRPLALMTHAIEYQFFGAEGNAPAISHLLNVLLYLWVIYYLWQVLRHWLFRSQPALAFIVAFLFVIHPIHTESVANLKGRDELLSFGFLMMTMHFFGQYLNNARSSALIVALGTYFLALLSKENGVTFLAIIPLTVYFFSKKSLTSSIAAVWPFLAVFVGYIFMRASFTSLDFSSKSVDVLNQPYVLATGMQAFATKCYVMGRYLALLCFPHPLSYDYSYSAISYKTFMDTKVLLSIVLHIVLGAIAVMQFKIRHMIAYAILFYLASISIVSNFVVNIGAFMGERFLFQASLGFCLLAGFLMYHGLERLSKGTNAQLTKPILLGGLALLTLTAGAKTVGRNTAWKDNYTLFNRDIDVVPMSAKAQKGCGEVILKRIDTIQDPNMKQANLRVAIRYFKRAADIHPKFSDAFIDMGTAYYYLEDWDSCAYAWNRAHEISPGHPLLIQNRGILAQRFYSFGRDEYNSKNYDPAIAQFKKAIAYNPKLHEAYHILGLAYAMQQQKTAAIQAFEQAVAIEPTNAQYWYDLGGLAFHVNDFPRAVRAFEQSLKHNPNQPNATNGLNAAKAELQKVAK
jgi:protein O-mannosyl-transferase